MRRRLSVLALVVALIMVSVPAWAQTVAVAQISGTVVDESGAPIPGATIKATQTSTGTSRVVISGSKGEYVLAALPVGPYAVEVTLDGFMTFQQTGIVLQVGSSSTINATLKVGSRTETVTVQASAPLVEARSTAVGEVIPEKMIMALPLAARQPTSLLLLSGAAVVNNSGGLIGSQRQYPSAVSISVAGGTGNSTAYLVDGGFNNDPLANVSQPLPFPDALQEFKVESGVRPARYGMYTGATVNAVTKSGTNAYHGSAFEFLRDHRFNEINYFATKDDGLSRNQYGGALGGPIQQNKMFFFAGFQGTHQKVIPTDQQTFVPTAKMLAGDFTDIASAACNPTAVTLPAPFVGNKIDPARFSAVALKMITGHLPLSTDPCGRITYGVPDNNDEKQYIGRLDWQASSALRVFGRYFQAKYDRKPAYDGTNLLLTTGNGLGLDNRVQTMAAGGDYTITSSLLSSTRVALALSSVFRAQGDTLFNFTDLGSKMWSGATTPGLSFYNMSITNGFPGPAFPGVFKSTTWQVSQDFDYIRDSHQFAAGAVWILPALDANGPFQNNGIFTFNGSRAGGGRIGMADFLLGLPSQFRQGGNQLVKNRMNYFAMYLQDTWRVNSRLTVNAGIRWEPYYSAVDKAGLVSHFSMEWFDANRHSAIYPNAPAGMMFQGDEGFPGQSNTFGNWKHFAPRVGFVWDPKGDGTQTLRAATGLFYESPKLWQYGRFPLNAPFGNTVTINNPTSFADPWATYAGGNPFPTPSPVPSNFVFPTQLSLVNMPLNVEVPRMLQYNVSYQRQILGNVLVSATYIGNKTMHLWAGKEINPAQYIPGASTTANTNQRRLLYLKNPSQGQYYADIPTTDDGASGQYNGLVVSIQKRLANHWSLSTNVTWSKCVNDAEPGIDIANSYPDPNDRGSNRGPCDTDRRIISNTSLVLESPGIGSGILQAITADWTLGTVAQFRSGAPLTASITGDLAFSGLANRPIQLGDATLDNPTMDKWFDTSMFKANSAGVWGSALRGSIRGPKYFNIDMTLSRVIRLGNDRKLEVRAEAFNVFNRLNLDNPTTNFSSTDFGKITSAQDPRIMQFAVKFSF